MLFIFAAKSNSSNSEETFSLEDTHIIKTELRMPQHSTPLFLTLFLGIERKTYDELNNKQTKFN